MDGRRLVFTIMVVVAFVAGLSVAGAEEFSYYDSPFQEVPDSPFREVAEPTVAEPAAPAADAPNSAAPTLLTSIWQDVVKGEPAPAKGGCDDDCLWCNMCPCTYAVVEALILERNVSGSSFPLVNDATTGDPVLTTNDLDFPFAGGLRAYVGHRFCDGWAWELGYFGLFDANASATASGELTLPGDLGPGTNVFFGADTITIDYTSRIHGGELNLVCCSCCCEPSGCLERCRSTEWIYGLRYLRVDEVLTFQGERTETGGVETGSYEVRTGNDLYGAQFGMRRRRCCGPWSVEGTGKIGLFANDASTTQTITDFPDFIVRQSDASEGNLALLVDLNASLIRQVSDHWYVRGGYNLIWIDGVALAPDQLDFTLTSTSGTTIDSGNTLFLHGVNLGLEARW